MAIKQSLSGSLVLTKLKHVLMTKKGKDGQPVEGIFIPIEVNKLLKKEKAVYMNCSVAIKDEPDQYDQIAFMQQRSSKPWKDMSDEEKEESKQLPYLGNFRDFQYSSNDDNSGDAGGGETFDEEDSLPF